MEFKVQSNSWEETFQLGRRLAGMLTGGDLICLFGDLGAGKTSFAQGVGAGLEISALITSPTFTLIHEYLIPRPRNGAERFIHMDLYRLKKIAEAEEIGVFDLLQDDTITLVEWPEIALDGLPEERLDLLIKGNGDLPRTFVFRTDSEEWLSRLRKGQDNEISHH